MKLYILAGRPCSGKTTFAHKMSEEFAIEADYLDVFCAEQTSKATKENQIMYKWKDFDLINALKGTPESLFKEYLMFYDELFPMLVDYLKSKQQDSLIIEGAIILPKYLKELSRHFDVEYAYLSTTDQFVDERYRLRDYAKGLSETKEGRIALENLLKRDIRFNNYILRQCKNASIDVYFIQDEGDFDSIYTDIKTKWFK